MTDADAALLAKKSFILTGIGPGHRPLNVFVFGETGAAKTSLIATLQRAFNHAVTVTVAMKKQLKTHTLVYTRHEISDTSNIRLYDGAGWERETEKGTNYSKQEFVRLLDGGIDLGHKTGAPVDDYKPIDDRKIDVIVFAIPAHYVMNPNQKDALNMFWKDSTATPGLGFYYEEAKKRGKTIIFALTKLDEVEVVRETKPGSGKLLLTKPWISRLEVSYDSVTRAQEFSDAIKTLGTLIDPANPPAPIVFPMVTYGPEHGQISSTSLEDFSVRLLEYAVRQRLKPANPSPQQSASESRPRTYLWTVESAIRNETPAEATQHRPPVPQLVRKPDDSDSEDDSD